MTEAPTQPRGFRLTHEVAQHYGRRGGLARAAKCRWYVDGEAVTSSLVASRLGITANAAEKRIRRLRKNGKPITWAALRLEKQS